MITFPRRRRPRPAYTPRHAAGTAFTRFEVPAGMTGMGGVSSHMYLPAEPSPAGFGEGFDRCYDDATGEDQ